MLATTETRVLVVTDSVAGAHDRRGYCFAVSAINRSESGFQSPILVSRIWLPVPNNPGWIHTAAWRIALFRRCVVSAHPRG